MEHELFHALLPIASNIVYVALSMAVGFLWNKAKGLQENREKTDRLISIHACAVKRNAITYTELERASTMYEAYHGLGGNGTGTAIMEELRRLHIQKDG